MNIVVAIIILLVYTLVMIKIGCYIPPSLSASVFNIPINKRWIWTVVIFTVCILIVPTYIEKTDINTQFLSFFSIGGLGFVGAAPLVKLKDDVLQFKVHEIGAIICAICSQLVLIFNYPILLCSWIIFIIPTIIIGWKNWRTKIFWGEMICFSNTFLYCLL